MTAMSSNAEMDTSANLNFNPELMKSIDASNTSEINQVRNSFFKTPGPGSGRPN